MKNTMRPRSLALSKFVQRMDAESRTYWNVACFVEYGQRWWKQMSKDMWPASISLAPGDNADPFRRVPEPPQSFLDGGPTTVSAARENAIVSFVTVFETYLFEALNRALCLQPDLAEDMKMQFTAQELSSPAMRGDFRSWFSFAIASNIVRSATHAQIVLKMNSILKLGLDKDDERLKQWRQWELVRNSIVHAARRVSDDLSKGWRQRFTSVGATLSLTDKDITRFQA